MMTGNGSYVAVIGLLMAEASNFPMHFRIICRQLDMKLTKIYELADWFYMAIYFLFRGIMSPVICTMTVVSPRISIMVKVAYLILQFQSFYFISIMFSICKKKMRENKERREKKAGLYWLSENPDLSKLDYVKKKEKQKVF